MSGMYLVFTALVVWYAWKWPKQENGQVTPQDRRHRLEQGDPVGHPSCEGGFSQSTHLHLARKYNGEWIAAGGPLPLVLSGWQFHSDGAPYDGTATRGLQERVACECRQSDYNGLVADR